MKKVSIIIPFKGQTEKNLSVVLGSVNGQIGIDFSEIDVHLVNDGGPTIDISKFDIFSNLDLHYHHLEENVGAGLARQYGIDHSESKYLMFMDSDDEFHFAGALLEFFNAVKGTGDHQIVIARYIEQYIVESGEFRYLIHTQYDWKSVYAKWFNRQYVEEQGIRFQPELRIFEDTYFVGLSCQLSTDIYYIDSVVYSWLYNANSLVRSNGKSFEYQTHTWALQNRLYFKKTFEKRPDTLAMHMKSYVADVYMRYTRYPPADEAAFWDEHFKLLEEFSSFWTGYDAFLQGMVDSLRDKEGQWQGTPTDKFQAFVEKTREKI
ncbi:MAG: glycosyltransferase family 2 protein [Lactovum sp.]